MTVLRPQLVTKSVEATIEPVADAQAANPNGEFVVRLATPGTDREGDDLSAKGWQQPLPEHITFDTDHGMSVAKLAGSGAPTLQRDGSIEVKGSYAGTEHGQTTRQLVNEGHIRTVSVTYLQRTTKAAGGKRTVVRELLNGSFVAVPANPKAVVLSSKALGDNDNDADDSTDPEERAEAVLAQTIHDAAVALGAECDADNVDADDAPAGKGLPYPGKGLPYPGKGLITYQRGEPVVTIVAKGIAGSVEELGDRVRKAVRDQHRSDRAYPYVRATFLDDPTKGTVVYDLESYGDMSSTSKTLARDFTVDGSKVTLDETPREVSLVTSVVDDQADAGAKGMATGDTVEQAVELLTKGAMGMTREAALELLGVDDSGAIVATSTAVGATAKGLPEAAAATAAASETEQRFSALMQSLDAAAG